MLSLELTFSQIDNKLNELVCILLTTLIFSLYDSSHPKYRAALFQKFPSLMCANESAPAADAMSTTTTVTEGEKAAA